jgi:hypothetical protein
MIGFGYPHTLPRVGDTCCCQEPLRHNGLKLDDSLLAPPTPSGFAHALTGFASLTKPAGCISAFGLDEPCFACMRRHARQTGLPTEKGGTVKDTIKDTETGGRSRDANTDSWRCAHRSRPRPLTRGKTNGLLLTNSSLRIRARLIDPDPSCVLRTRPLGLMVWKPSGKDLTVFRWLPTPVAPSACPGGLSICYP